MIATCAVLLLAQQQIARTTPAGGDTTGYWQQDVAYEIVGRLDEQREVLVASGEMTYVNNSPDTLDALYLHQHLNAFRPGSQWSAVDAREGRVRFQRLPDPEYAYERFTAAPVVDGRSVRAEYPFAPDSTVVRFPLAEPLAPGDTVHVSMQWEARPSTLPRRQGRAGRQYDFAQWYPRIAPYDRTGWAYNPLRPAGEFYGEFGRYDVTLVLPQDQVIGATGVPVEGDPGWRRVLRWGEVVLHDDAYENVGPGPRAEVPPGYRAVRFVARDVHHFAWSVSPDYRYEGGLYARPVPEGAVPFAVWDTVPIHVLYRPGDEPQWGNGQAVERTARALAWLESIFGPYAYPQVTNLHRIESGGTEFPMVMMNGSASQGLILHELAHIYAHGILANNEWASGWLDEGLVSYLTAWATVTTPQDTATFEITQPEGYRGRAALPPRAAAERIEQTRLDLTGRAEPIGTASHEFSEYSIYTAMIYTRAETMYGQLRDVMGDEAFRAFLADYYRRWGLKHVDELAMRASAERAHGASLDWFFDQWVHRTGLIDYAITDADIARDGGSWVTRVRVTKRGEYFHPMPVGLRTDAGWTVTRAEPLQADQWVTVRTARRPTAVRLDPFGTTADWDARNDWASSEELDVETRRYVFDWPLLEQWEEEREIVALRPVAWYSGPGGLTIGLRQRTNYQGWTDELEGGAVITAREPETGKGAPGGRVQAWLIAENPRLWPGTRPVVGVRFAAGLLDNIALVDLSKEWDLSRFLFAAGPRTSLTLGLTVTEIEDGPFVPEGWSPEFVESTNVAANSSVDVYGAWMRTSASANGSSGISASARLGWKHQRYTIETPGPGGPTFIETTDDDWFTRFELSARRLRYFREGRTALFARAYMGSLDPKGAPGRGIYLSAASPLETYFNHWWRPQESILKLDGAHYVPLGGAGLRGYDPLISARSIGAVNLEAAHRVAVVRRTPQLLSLWASVFADGGLPDWELDDALADAGVGLSLRGMLFDRDVRLRLDFPLYVSDSELALDGELGDDPVRFRWMFSLRDFW